MEQDTLKEILEVEKQIKETLDTETARAHQWLEQSKREIEEERQAEIAELNATVARGREEAKTTAEEKAAEVVERARSFAIRIEELDDDCLRQVTWGYIADIVPRINRDR